MEDVGRHPEFRRREWAEPHGVTDLDERLVSNSAVSKYSGEIALDDLPVFHEDRVFLDQLRPIFPERLDRFIDDLSVLGFKAAAELLDEPLVLARVRAAEEEHPGLLPIIREQFFDLARPNIGEFPILDERLFNALTEGRHPENLLPECLALVLPRLFSLRLVLPRL